MLTVSPGVLVPGVAVVPELGGFAGLWLPRGHMLLLGRSSGMVPVGAGGAEGKKIQEKRCSKHFTTSRFQTCTEVRKFS